MNSVSLLKRIARKTRSWRIALGIAREPETGSAHLVRSVSRRALPGGRLSALERDVDRLLAGWNQHIPQFLAGFAEARRSHADCAGTRQALVEIRKELAELRRENEALRKRVDEAEGRTVRGRKTR